MIAAPAAATAPASTEISWKTPCRVVAGLVGWSVILGKVPLCKLRVDAAIWGAARNAVVCSMVKVATNATRPPQESCVVDRHPMITCLLLLLCFLLCFEREEQRKER